MWRGAPFPIGLMMFLCLAGAHLVTNDAVVLQAMKPLALPLCVAVTLTGNIIFLTAGRLVSLTDDAVHPRRACVRIGGCLACTPTA